ncbi:hypothetical protein Clacol_005342 [Clathrus columnatus]|uniref:SCA7 domain-containing protein n=1 Tax=Clathrus columnatus TaxID=1419009 RepID=A0AAV5ADN3_9AGAM|nr:hypothetical protein Clacol_005342 [Clathrus columnatus]
MSLRTSSLTPSEGSPFTFQAYLSPSDKTDNETGRKRDLDTPPNDPISLPSPPTSWLSAKDMRVFGATPLTASIDIGIVRCKDCQKPILKSAIVDHSGKKRKYDEGEDGPPNKKARPAPKITKGRAKGPIDYDRQCGVINDKGLPCSRSLTCKSHSMGAKRAVGGRSRLYDDLLLDWNRAHNPNFVEPVKRETKAEKKEKRDREREEKRKAKELAGELKKGQTKTSKATTKKKTKDGKGVLIPTVNEGEEDEEEAGAEEDVDSENEMEGLIRAIRLAGQKGLIGVPLATTDDTDTGTFFIARRERLRACRDLLSGALVRRTLTTTTTTSR